MGGRWGGPWRCWATPTQGLTSWACRRLAFHSCRMITSHCCTVVSLRSCGGRPANGAAPVVCLPLCWLTPTKEAPELEVSTSSSLKHHFSTPEVLCSLVLPPTQHPPQESQDGQVRGLLPSAVQDALGPAVTWDCFLPSH
jgi:hypothetical protein